MSIPPNNPTTPSEPTSFTIQEQVNGTLGFSMGAPIVKPIGTQFQILRSVTTLANANSLVTLWEGAAQNVNVLVPNTTQWYFARCIANSYLSALYPNTFGTGALPADVQWSFSVDSVGYNTVS